MKQPPSAPEDREFVVKYGWVDALIIIALGVAIVVLFTTVIIIKVS